MNKVLFVGSTYIKPDCKAPHWNDFHSRWYVEGYRWIKTKKAFSTVRTLHNFLDYEWIDEAELPN